MGQAGCARHSAEATRRRHFPSSRERLGQIFESDDGEEGRRGQAQGRAVAAYGVVGGTEERAVTSDGDTRDRHILLGDQLVRAIVLA